VEQILHQVEHLETEYDWLEAAESYKKALNLLSEDDFSQKGDITERMGYALYRAAFQAENNDMFRERMRQAVLSHEKAKEFYAKMTETEKAGRMSRCDAVIALTGYWLASEAQEKKKLTAECWKLAKNCLEASEKAGDACEYGRTYNQLSTCIDLGFFFEWDFKARKKMMGEAVDYGERAIKFLSSVGDPRELARAYAKTAAYTSTVEYYFADLEDREKYSQKATDYWLKAKEISEETAMLELPSVIFGSGSGGYWGDGTDDALSNFEKALECSWKTRDKFNIGRALDLLAYHNAWRVGGTEDPDERTALQKKAHQQAEDAKHQYLTISFTSPRGGVNWTEATYLWYYLGLAYRETDLNKKRELVGMALEAAPDMLKRAENSGYPDIKILVHSGFAGVLRESAKIEADSEEKKRLLEKALVHSEESVAISEQVQPLAYWNLGIMRGVAITSRYELAGLAKDPEAKKNMLQKILRDSEDALELCIKGTVPYKGEAATPMLRGIANWEVGSGDCLYLLYELTSDKEYLKRAIEAFQRGIETFQKTNQTSRLAESYWKVAKTYDALGEHVKAADNFDHASGNYRSAVEKIPQLKDFYQDHALYMQAWSEIEKARYHHERQEYGSAEEHFEKAAELHKSLKQWSYLEPNYSAWAQVEKAEELSRKEQSEEATEAFEQASKLFSEIKKSLQTQFSKIEDTDEKQMVTGMIRASDLRKEYCEGRIALEEAKILDKKGDHYSSSGKYGSAADAFEKMIQESKSEQDRKELQLIINLSRAWQKMTLAEARSSPALYREASQIFEQAEDLSPNEKTKMLILGHSRFCKALEAGTRFADSRDATLHQIAEQHLESAANYYVKAGFQNASEYSKAMEYLFDAYLYMDDAKRERDPEKKARLYTMAEKVLQTSAGSFMKAEHPEKSAQVSRLLDKIKEEKELALSLSEVLHAPSIVSTTTAFTALTPNQENAVGLERFENADIQASLIIRQKEVKVGEPLSLTIELVNAGKAPALLIKVNEVIPEGFELGEKPETCRVEDSYIDMKGKRLGPLKTEELKLVLKSKVQGTFVLKPTILYLDENGQYRSYEPEAVSITVKELGIKGWLKGER